MSPCDSCELTGSECWLTVKNDEESVVKWNLGKVEIVGKVGWGGWEVMWIHCM